MSTFHNYDHNSYHSPDATDLAVFRREANARREHNGETTVIHFHPFSLTCAGQHHELFEVETQPETTNAAH